MSQQTALLQKPVPLAQSTTYKILYVIGICHLLNDAIQAVVPAMFPIIEKSLDLSFTQLGFIAFALNMISSVMQPAVGLMTDKKPMPYALPMGLSASMAGVLGLAFAPNFGLIILSVLFIGIGSAIFHPEGSRVAYLAAGPRRGLAQSIYQVGGNSGQALAPLITALVLVPFGQRGAAFFSLVAAAAVGLLIYIARWYTEKLAIEKKAVIRQKRSAPKRSSLAKRVVPAIIFVLLLIFARSWYISGITSFYAFFAIKEYSFSIQHSQYLLFAFLVAGAAGTFFGGPLADRFGKKTIIAVSMLAAVPFSAIVPFLPPAAALACLVLNGFILMTSFSVTVVYAQELVPGKIGLMSGLTVGLAFGMGAIGSVGLGLIADLIGLKKMIIGVGFVPLLGLCALFLPSDKTVEQWNMKNA
ncbi:MFS transporter [Neobacillus notoginsengisoli]|uniref:MFS transporter n=1 Tax=Neobacillus notoginsengisoli TaxID=1578198 RepID=A0A417YFH0_9BACI|nr:MFS transporter [Neobacillus notoginsengisoli]RHW31417.1 MFS transporter [Neobacillus notoginsengisoli]